MDSQWIVVEDKRKHDKRWVKIEDTVNKRQYSSYFKLSDNDSVIIAKLKQSVRQHRHEIEDKETLKLDLSNFEARL